MQPEIVLTFVDAAGRVQSVAVAPTRYTVGRGTDNDLSVGDSNLSRRHAVIERAGGSVLISDCGSRNGTAVNDSPVRGEVELTDGDRVTLGGSFQFTVNLKRPAHAHGSSPFTPPVIAGAAVALILAAAGVLLLLSPAGGSGKARAGESVVGPGKLVENFNAGGLRPDTTPRKSDPTPGAGEPGSPAGDGVEQVGRAVRRVMSKISNDSEPFVPEAAVKDVARRVEEYRGSPGLRERLRAAKRGCPEITARAQGFNLKPALVMYAALADSEGGAQGGDPLASARRMLPKLLTLRATFGTETADSSLLLVAAYPYPFNPPIGSQARTPHPLASKLMEMGGRRSTVDTSEARSVWFLREKHGITNEAYDLVIRLLAIGVIAQNPGQYGIEADPPLC
jgi:hypothetical protein